MSFPSIATSRFDLVSMTLAFMRLLADGDEAAAQAEIGALIPDGYSEHLTDFLAYRIPELEADPAIQPWLGRVIVFVESDGTRRVIGSAGFHAAPGSDGRAEVGYRVEPAYRRTGVATEVVTALFDWAHAQGVNRFRASVSPGNVASLAVIARFGFRQTGVQIDDIDGEELVFELDGWPPAP